MSRYEIYLVLIKALLSTKCFQKQKRNKKKPIRDELELTDPTDFNNYSRTSQVTNRLQSIIVNYVRN
jgi:hypothetical protein